MRVYRKIENLTEKPGLSKDFPGFLFKETLLSFYPPFFMIFLQTIF